MVRRVVTAPRAARGLAAARRWLTQPGSGEAGRRRWEELRTAPSRLRAYPYSGMRDTEQPGHYVLTRHGYRLIYTIRPDTGDSTTAGDIRLVAVLGPGQEEAGP